MKVNRLLIKHRNLHLGQYLFGLLHCDKDLEAVTPRCSVKKVVLKNFAILIEKDLWQSLFFDKGAG